MARRPRHGGLLAVLLACAVTPSRAQQPFSAAASLGARSGAQEAAVSIWRPLLRPSSRLRLGAGLRLSAFGGESTSYVNRETVQGGLTSGLAIDPAVFAANAAVFAELDVAGGFSLGANLDLAGVAAGPERTSGTLRAKPQRLSSFRYGKADHGTLNSEFFVSVRVAPRARIRAGASHYVTDYIVTDAGAGGAPSARYQRFETVPFAGITLRL